MTTIIEVFRKALHPSKITVQDLTLVIDRESAAVKQANQKFSGQLSEYIAKLRTNKEIAYLIRNTPQTSTHPNWKYSSPYLRDRFKEGSAFALRRDWVTSL